MRPFPNLEVHWVPSHGKESKNFAPPPEHTEQLLRIVNRRADDEATAQLNAMMDQVALQTDLVPDEVSYAAGTTCEECTQDPIPCRPKEKK